MKKNLKLILSSLLMLLFVVACGKSESGDNAKKSAETITVTTPKGDVNVPKEIKKAVVFDYGVLDTMNALGVENIELMLPSSNLPKSLSKYKEKAQDGGDIKEPNLEKINEFKPDVIIISGRQEKSYEELKKIAPVLYMELDNENYIKSSFENAKTIAKVFGKEKEVEAKIGEVNNKVNEIKKLTGNFDKKVLVTLTNDGKISAYGKGSRFGFIFTDLGLKSVDETIKASTHGQEINFEYISEKNPDIIYYVDRTKIVGGSKDGGNVLNNTLVVSTNAGKNKKIIALDSEIWYLVSGGLNSIETQINEIQNSLK